MSIHSEIQNFKKNRSGDKPITIHNRSGDGEDGKSFFEFLPSRLANPSGELIEDENKAERIDFLKRYFSILKSALNPIEYFAVKESLKNGGELREICRANFINPFITVSIREKLQKVKTQIEELVEDSDWDRAGVFVRCFLRSAADISRDGQALQEVRQAIQRRGIADKIDEAERLRNERKIRQNGFNRGKAYSRNRVLRYIEDIVSLAEFKPYIQQYISAELKKQINELRSTIDCFLSERMLDFAFNDYGESESEKMQYIRAFFTVAAQEFEKIADGFEAHNIFKNAILSDEVSEIFGNVEDV